MKPCSRTPRYRVHFPSAIPTSNSAPGLMASPMRTSAATKCEQSGSPQRLRWPFAHFRCGDANSQKTKRKVAREITRHLDKSPYSWTPLVLGAGLFHVIVSLFVCFLGLGFGISVGRKLLDGLAETHGTGAGDFCFERSEATWNVQVLGHVGSGDALAQILEAAAGRLSVLTRQRLDFAGDGCVMAKHVVGRSVRHIRMAHCTSLIGFAIARTRRAGRPTPRRRTPPRMPLSKGRRTTSNG